MPENTGRQDENRKAVTVVDTRSLLNHLTLLDLEIAKMSNAEARLRFADSAKNIRQELKKFEAQLKVNYDNYFALLESLKEFKVQVEELRKELDKLTEPPLFYGYVARLWPEENKIDVYVCNERRKVNVLTGNSVTKLKIGQRVILTGNFSVLSVDDEWEKTGEEAKVAALLDQDIARVVTRFDETSDVILAEPLKHEKIAEGDILMISGRFAFKKLPKTKEVEQLFLAEMPDVTYERIGGLESKIKRIRELIEWPYLYRDKYVKHGLKPPKGILLFGPPGCGKTLTAKAVANALGKKTSGGRSYFMNIRGPELLNKWVGETERLIREVFRRAKELATEKIPVIVFFDEIDALFPIRGSQISADTASTTVPQFTTEMDGVENLDNVIVIGATNRQDRIDPAVIRPGRFDDRIEIGRPDKSQALHIFSIYLNGKNTILHPQYFNSQNYEGDYYIPKDRSGNSRKDKNGNVKKYPLAKDPANIASYMLNSVIDRIFDPKKELNQLVRVAFVGGGSKTLYASDFISGSVIESIVNKAKRLAFGDYISSGEKSEEEGLKLGHLMASLEEEFESQAKLPSVANPNEWASIFGINERIIDAVPLTEERRKKQEDRAKEKEVVPTGQYL